MVRLSDDWEHVAGMGDDVGIYLLVDCDGEGCAQAHPAALTVFERCVEGRAVEHGRQEHGGGDGVAIPVPRVGVGVHELYQRPETHNNTSYLYWTASLLLYSGTCMILILTAVVAVGRIPR